jgi:hypothetical protein
VSYGQDTALSTKLWDCTTKYSMLNVNYVTAQTVCNNREYRGEAINAKGDLLVFIMDLSFLDDLVTFCERTVKFN